jgi:protein-S-isoprenylcysteine O-methyltransferase Ste14
MKAVRNLISFILPITVLIVIPVLIENDFHLKELWTTVLGSFFICMCLIIIILTIRMFIQIGRGTLAPWDPTRKLVTSGLYAYIRNPMILGVFTGLIGETVLFQSLNIGIWAGLFFVINTLYFILLEEPGLEKRFGEEYREYKENVPRWIPKWKS